jgi:hypothetical protein
MDIIFMHLMYVDEAFIIPYDIITMINAAVDDTILLHSCLGSNSCSGFSV